MPAKTTAPKTTTSKKVIVRKATAKTAPKTAPKKATPKKAPAKSTWVTQSTVGYDAEIGASRFTTQTQRRLLREIVAAKSMSFADAKPATLRSLDRLKSLGLVTVAKSVAKATKRGADLVA